jgi:hypothetical protein
LDYLGVTGPLKSHHPLTEHISSAGTGITKSLPAGGNLLSLAIEHLVSVNPRRGNTDYGRRPILMTASTGSLK